MRVLAAIAFGVSAHAAVAQDVTAARYVEPTTRYGHAILGDDIEWGAIEMTVGGQRLIVRLPDTHVFEDVAPRLVDIDRDGARDVMVVETSIVAGARLAIYDGAGAVKAATPYIGRTHRWLAPIGAADMDGDGAMEVAYIDRPHLAKTLRIWRYVDGALVNVADLAGLTNHRIGESDIGGGMRVCDGVIEAITASADWQRVVATRFENGVLVSRDVGPHTGRKSLADALRC